MEDMDLTNARRAARNADGIVFYKMWNGRKKPKMPALKDELTKDQVWQIVDLRRRRCRRSQSGSRAALSEYRGSNSPMR